MGVNPDAVSRLGKLYGGRFPSSPSSRSQKINYFNRLLGIGEFHREVNATSVIITITHDAAKLVTENRDWPRSNLTANRGKLDLVSLLHEFHSRMMHHYAGFVAKTFFPELFPAAEFYGRLTEEVRKSDPGFTMFFHPGELDIKTEGDVHNWNLHLSLVPNDVFAELGLAFTVGKK
jgi:hypothetical protein